MSLEFRKFGKKLSPIKIKKFEKKYKLMLPPAYREFLLRFNGGYPKADFSFSFLENKRQSESVIRVYYSLDEDSDDFDYLGDIYEDFVVEGRMPANYLPFAEDVFGNQICLSISGADSGNVFFWNHEKEPDPENKPVVFSNVHFIAQSFKEFLNMLEEVK